MQMSGVILPSNGTDTKIPIRNDALQPQASHSRRPSQRRRCGEDTPISSRHLRRSVETPMSRWGSLRRPSTRCVGLSWVSYACTFLHPLGPITSDLLSQMVSCISVPDLADWLARKPLDPSIWAVSLFLLVSDMTCVGNIGPGAVDAVRGSRARERITNLVTMNLCISLIQGTVVVIVGKRATNRVFGQVRQSPFPQSFPRSYRYGWMDTRCNYAPHDTSSSRPSIR